MRIGIFGGSFNPPHNGHIALAAGAVKAMELDELILTVAKLPPHKRIAGGVSGRLRFLMTKRAMTGIEKVTVSDMELNRRGKSYTYDTLKAVRRRDPDAELFLFTGADMLKDLPTWWHAQEIIDMVTVVGVRRPGSDVDFDAAARVLKQSMNANVVLADIETTAVSSTEVRERIENGLSAEGLIPGDVEQLIYERGLYFTDSTREMLAWVRERVNRRRYTHICGTMRCAAVLAERYGVDPYKARIAAMLHDCAKVKDDELLSLAERLGVEVDGYAKRSPGLLHEKVGARLASEELGVTDDDIIAAIACHTLGRVNMTKLDKLLYVADKIEPTRTYPGTDKLRIAAEIGLDTAAVACMDSAVASVIGLGRSVDPKIYRARESIINNMSEEESSLWKRAAR